MNNISNRVVVTGMGIICSIGNNTRELEESLKQGKSGLKAISKERFCTENTVYKTKHGCTLDESVFNEISNKDLTVLGHASKIAIDEALSMAKLDIKEAVEDNRVGLALGTSVGTSYSFMQYVKSLLAGTEGDNYDLLFNTAPTIAGTLAKEYSLNGAITTVSTACASGTNSIGRAFDFLNDDRADIMIAGGVDLFTELTFSGFNSLQALAIDKCRPFDENRDGLNLGDAAAFVILEKLDSAKRRNAPIYAEINGYSILNEAYHPTAPSPGGEFALKVMLDTFNETGLAVGDVDYINVHGTGTKANDAMEALALKKLLKNNDKTVFFSSTKSMLGHTLGAAGAVEIVTTIIALNKRFIPPSCNVVSPILQDPHIQLAEEAFEDKEINVALSNSFGFAGNMASILFSKYNN